MGLFEAIFGRKAKYQRVNGSDIFQTLTAYRPAFKTWDGRLYENELIRAVVDAHARHISKLKIEFTGKARPSLQTAMKAGPNPFMSWSNFLYRLATIWDINDTAFIIPVVDKADQTVGYFPVLPQNVEIVEAAGVQYLRYQFANQQKACIELDRCAVLPRHQYSDDFFGEGNGALSDTMALLNAQTQGIQEGIKNSASFRFIAKASNFLKIEDLAKERKRYDENMLRGESGGVLLFPSTYNDIKQIEQKPFIVDADQAKLIRENVFNYFGANEKILQNSAIGDDLDAYFDGAIEPFMVMVSEAMTRMTFTQREISTCNRVILTANRLQYMSTTNKIALAKEMGDRGVLRVNEIRELFNYPPLEGPEGEKLPARGEYYDFAEGKDETKEQEDDANG